jgi:hypothetical protein
MEVAGQMVLTMRVDFLKSGAELGMESVLWDTTETAES